MIRRPILRYAGPALLIALLAAGPMPSARGQTLSVQERLDRLERDLSMLQRQVYSRSGGIPEIRPGSKEAVDLEIRMERLEQQMRELTGRVETVANEVEQLRHQVEQNAGESGAQAAGAQPGNPPAAASPRPGTPEPSTNHGDLPPPRNLLPGGGGPASQDSGGPAAPDNGGAPPPPGKQAGAAPPAISGELPSGSALRQYNFAFGLLKAANYPAAERALRAFVHRHPDNSLADNAQYWLGETYYMRGRYADAASAFAEGYRRFPKGNKAPDDLLRLGMSLARAGQRKNACVAFGQLDHAFPRARAAIKSTAAAEKKRLGC